MSAKHTHITPTEQPDWRYSAEATPEGADASATLTYRGGSAAVMATLPLLNSAHPTLTALILKKIDVEGEEGDMCKVVLSYKPTNATATYPGRPDRDIPGRSYSLEPSTTEEPLLTNYLFKDLSNAERERLTELMASSKTKEDFRKATDNVTSEEGILAITKIRKGIESYLNPGLIWTEKYQTENLADLQLSNILTTTSTPPGPCPPCGDNRNWLYLAGPATLEDDGITYNIERRFQLSEKGKWDPDLYPAAS